MKERAMLLNFNRFVSSMIKSDIDDTTLESDDFK